MKGYMFVVFLLTAASLANAGAITGDGVLYYQHGHYWIELTLYGQEKVSALTGEPRPSQFEVLELAGGGGRIFNPSRVEVVSSSDSMGVLVLSSGKFKRDECYRVVYEPDGCTEVVVDSICGPFHFVPGDQKCPCKCFFRKYVAAAFSRSGESYKLNQLGYQYDLTAEKSYSSLSIQPGFEFGDWELEPVFEQNEVTYHLEESGKTPVRNREFGLTVSWSAWIRELKLGLAAGYEHKRSSLFSGAKGSTLYAQSLIIEGRTRFDNLFDSVNRYCLSVFKGIDFGFGYAWYQSNDREVWGSSDFERTTPFAKIRLTWTFLYGFQISYSLESYWPESLNDRFEEFHSIRFRLLLRDVLSAYDRHPYHPDLELALDTGRRLPFFEREERVVLGFKFDLFPW